jgi:ubiquinone/menaquinone biosynthesis C-methylase UbiE
VVLQTETEIKDKYRGDDAAARYVERRFASELHRLLHERQVAAVQQAIDSLRPAHILEVAPGPGRLTRDVRPTGTLVCLEYNEGMLEHGRSACPGKAVWVRGNGFQLPFAADAFDLVYSFRFVRHFRQDDRRRLYAAVRRVLRPGGAFVMDAVNGPVSRPLRDASPQDYPVYDKLHREEELREELSAAGLEVALLEPVQRCFRWQLRCQTLLGPRSGWLNRLAIRALERLSRTEGLEWIVTCRRA